MDQIMDQSWGDKKHGNAIASPGLTEGQLDFHRCGMLMVKLGPEN